MGLRKVLIVARKVFYSFHYDKDVHRVQQVLNMGVIQDAPPLDHSEWEKLQKVGEGAIKKWINEQMSTVDCLVVLIGEETAKRPWVRYEINHAWTSGKAIIGIHIHSLKNLAGQIGNKGSNPFSGYTVKINGVSVSMVSVIQVYDPPEAYAYNAIYNGISGLVNTAINTKKN